MKRFIITLKTILLFSILTVFTSCSGQNHKTVDIKAQQTANPILGDTVSEIGKNIRCIFQDSKNNFWFGSDEEGVYHYDGISVIQFTEKDGLSDNQVRTIQEDNLGNIWFNTGGGVSRFDGRTLTTTKNNETSQFSISSNNEWKIEPDDLWFEAGLGIYRYDGKSLNYLQFPETKIGGEYHSKHESGSVYQVYSIYKDSKGNVWFGTQSLGVCCYNGNSFTWLNEKGLGAPIRSIFEDKSGNLWFGNNGFGLFRFDGKNVTNFTEQQRLSNPEFLKSLKSKEGTLARVWTINQDNDGDLWIGTIDAGVWRYDGKSLTNYTTKDGLSSNAIQAIYKDNKGELWFGTGGEGVYKFNGEIFTKFTVK